MWAYDESLIAALINTGKRIVESRKEMDGNASADEPLQESVLVLDEAVSPAQSEEVIDLAFKAAQLHGLGSLKRAMDAYDEAISLDAQDIGSLRVQAFLSDLLGRPGRALQIYSRILQENPIDPCAWLGRADALLKMEMYEESLSAFEEALMVEPGMVRAWIGKGDALANLGRRDDALFAYRNSLRLADKAISKSPEGCSAWTWVYRGDSFNGLGRHNDAIEAYNRAIEICPDISRAWRGKGDAFMRIQQ